MLQVFRSSIAPVHRPSFVGSELKDTKVVDAIKVDTTKNIADMMTKCLPHTVRKSLETQIAEKAKSLALAQAI